MKRLLFTLIFGCLYCLCHSQSFDTLYIEREVDTISLPVHMCVFSDSSKFHRPSQNFWFNVNENWNITVVNNDTLEHDFTIDGVLTSNNTIPAGDTMTFNINLINEGSFVYYSSKDYGIHLGASGIVQVGYSQESHYFWNLFDQDTSLSQEIAESLVYAPQSNYRPQIFVINNLRHPITLTDPDQYVSQSVGDSIVISIANTGKMNHIIHFHGYHVEIMDSKESPHMIGWSKDTFPVELNEVMTIRLIPDKPGIYPVHDHNLTTLTTGAYPGGMMTRLNITP